jgi:hypothetical protein
MARANFQTLNSSLDWQRISRVNNTLKPYGRLRTRIFPCTFTKCAPRRYKRGFDLISDALPFGGLWYTQVSDAIGYAEFYSRSHDAVIRVYDDVGNVIQADEQQRQFQRSAEVLDGLSLPSCSVFIQTASVRQEIDCKLRSNYS